MIGDVEFAGALIHRNASRRLQTANLCHYATPHRVKDIDGRRSGVRHYHQAVSERQFAESRSPGNVHHAHLPQFG